MAKKYFGQAIPQDRDFISPDDQLIHMAEELRGRYEEAMERYAFQDALVEVFKVVARANKYIDETAPWALGKDPAQAGRLAAVLYNLLEIIRISAILLTPFIPDSVEKIMRQLGVDESAAKYESALYFANTEYCVNKTENLFPRIDMKKELELLEQKQAEQEAAGAQPAAKQAKPKAEQPKDAAPEGIITIDDFKKVKLIVAKVTACEPVPKSDKLLRLSLDDGTGTGRQVVSGIHQWYQPEDLVGKKVVVVANLRPAKLRGVMSEGMILAADSVKPDGAEDVRVVFMDDSIPCGSSIH